MQSNANNPQHNDSTHLKDSGCAVWFLSGQLSTFVHLHIATTECIIRQFSSFWGRAILLLWRTRYCDGYGSPVIGLQTCCASSVCPNLCSRQNTPCRTLEVHSKRPFHKGHARPLLEFFQQSCCAMPQFNGPLNSGKIEYRHHTLKSSLVPPFPPVCPGWHT